MEYTITHTHIYIKMYIHFFCEHGVIAASTRNGCFDFLFTSIQNVRIHLHFPGTIAQFHFRVFV